MNFKRNCLLITALISTVFFVTSCGDENNFEHYSYLEVSEDKHEDVDLFNDGKVVQYGEYSDIVTKKGANLGNVSKVMRNNLNKFLLNTTGEEKILVVPVDFKNHSVNNLGITKEEYISNLNDAFFGVYSNNRYVSVAEYFNLSSYGKMKLDGKVVDDFFTFNMNIQDVQKSSDRSLISSLYDDILVWLANEKKIDLDEFAISELTNPDATTAERKDIPLFLVYTQPFSQEEDENSNSLLWAFTFPQYPLSWASYSFLNTEYGNPDAHTFIHETGHLFGLSDYYPDPENKSEYVDIKPDPTGRIDMMDCSVGDETGYSKMLLDWVRPYHVTDSVEITLKSFSESGELLLLNDNWNKSTFDEYFLIEFYSPTGLNTFDSTIGNSQAKLPTMPGLKIYHVDARLGFFENTPRDQYKTFRGYINEKDLDITNTNVVGFAHNNNTYKNISVENANRGNYLYQLILNGADKLISGCANNSHLFRKGDTFDQLILNNGTNINYSIKVNSLNYKECSLTITKQ